MRRKTCHRMSEPFLCFTHTIRRHFSAIYFCHWIYGPYLFRLLTLPLSFSFLFQPSFVDLPHFACQKKNAFSPSRYLKIPLLCIKTWYDYRFCFGISTLRLDNLTETRGEYSLILIYRVVLNIVWLLTVFAAPRQCDFTTLMERVLLLALAFVLPMDTFNFEISWHDEEADPFKVRTNWIIL